MNKYKNEFMGILWAIGLLNLWYLSSIAIENNTLPKYYEYIINIITVTFSTTLGAYLAFKYNASIEAKKKKAQEKEDELIKVAKLNRALFNMCRQINAIKNMKSIIEQYDGDYNLAFNMPAEKNFDNTAVIDFDELALILPTELPLLLSMNNKQIGFFSTVESFNERTDIFLNQLRHEMAKLNLLYRDLSYKEAKEKLSPLTFEAMLASSQLYKENVLNMDAELTKGFIGFRYAC